MAIDTAENFFEVLEKSRLLTAQQLADARASADWDKPAKAAAKALVKDDLLTRWQAGQLLAGRSSFYLGKYKLIEPIGRGGMGGVFLGQHTTMNRCVALKILSRQVGRDPASLERFLDEARAVAALDHPNIVQAYSVDHDADRYYLVMEYIDGRDLKTLVEVEGLPDFETAADYVRQAADGLAHGHGRNMIHCDIKPSNLLVNGRGALKIVDMGLARLNGRGRQEFDGQGQRILGSVDYLAPEQALESADLDHRADIYSLGCTLYFLLTGHPPFPEGTLSQRIVKHQMQQPRNIHRDRRDAPASLVMICEKMMAKRAEDRFQSAEEVSRVMSQWQLPEPKHEAGVPLKTAQPLEGSSAERLPAIELGAETQPTVTSGANKKDSSNNRGVLRTRRRKIAALAVAALVAVTSALLIGSARAPTKRKQTQAGASTGADEQQEAADRRSTPWEEPGSSRDEPPAENRPADKPPAEKPPTDKPPTDKPPTDKPPADLPQADPRQTDPPQPAEPDNPPPKQPAQEPPKPRKEPPEPKRTDPLGRLATAVDLPLLRANPSPNDPPGEPVSLGTLDLGPHATCEIELKGGKDALPGNRDLALDPDPGGKEWLIHLEAEGQPETDVRRTDLARIRLDQQTLMFQWLDGVGRSPGDYLRNCGLLVRVGRQTRWLPLCRPKTVDPLLLDLDAGVARISLATAAWMPRIDGLRVQIAGLEGPFPEHGFTPPDGISEDGRVEVFMSGENLPGVGLRLRLTGRRRSACAELTAFYQLVDQVPRQFKSKQAFQLSGEFVALQKRGENALDKLKREDPRRPEVKRRIELCKQALEQLKALGDLYHQIHLTGRIHFRVFRPVDGYQIELFTTKMAKPEDAGEKEQADYD